MVYTKEGKAQRTNEDNESREPYDTALGPGGRTQASKAEEQPKEGSTTVVELSWLLPPVLAAGFSAV